MSLKSKVESALVAARCPARKVSLPGDHGRLHAGQIVATWTQLLAHVYVLADTIPLVRRASVLVLLGLSPLLDLNVVLVPLLRLPVSPSAPLLQSKGRRHLLGILLLLLLLLLLKEVLMHLLAVGFSCLHHRHLLVRVVTVVIVFNTARGRRVDLLWDSVVENIVVRKIVLRLHHLHLLFHWWVISHRLWHLGNGRGHEGLHGRRHLLLRRLALEGDF